MNNQNEKKQYGFITPGIYKPTFTTNNFYKMDDFVPVLINNKPKIIGEGRFSKVYLFKNKNNDLYYALKKILVSKILESGNDINIIKREINIHSRLSHENVVQFYSVKEEINEVSILLEYCKNGSIFELIDKNGFDEYKTYTYFSQVVNAIYFLHKNNLVHRDIKPENILLNSDKIKLCDFGWCCETNTNNRNSFCGTFEYMAPEIINELPYGKPVDIWALGILLYEFYYGVSPFNSNRENEEQNKEIIDNILQKRLYFPNRKKISYDMKDLIIHMLNSDVSKRYTIDQVVAHPWFKKCQEEINNKNIKINLNINYNNMPSQEMNITKITKIIKKNTNDILYQSSLRTKTPIKNTFNSTMNLNGNITNENKYLSNKSNTLVTKLVNIDINTNEDDSSPYKDNQYFENIKNNIQSIVDTIKQNIESESNILETKSTSYNSDYTKIKNTLANYKTKIASDLNSELESIINGLYNNINQKYYTECIVEHLNEYYTSTQKETSKNEYEEFKLYNISYKIGEIILNSTEEIIKNYKANIKGVMEQKYSEILNNIKSAINYQAIIDSVNEQIDSIYDSTLNQSLSKFASYDPTNGAYPQYDFNNEIKEDIDSSFSTNFQNIKNEMEKTKGNTIFH